MINSQTLPQCTSRPTNKAIDKDLKKFLNYVAEGEQIKAEIMLNINPGLALISGDVIDLSNKEFKNITGFQYAIWALDWHMWKMILSYLPIREARLQCELMELGSWVKKFGIHANWNNLIHALQRCVNFYNKQEWDAGNKVWVQQVGGAQLTLPAHVVNEYCHPTRPFDPCPNYTSAEILPRSRKIQMYKDGWKDAGELFYCIIPDEEPGITFALGRGGWLVCGVDSVGGLCAEPDLISVSTLYNVRMDQRKELISTMKPKNAQALMAAEVKGNNN